MFNLIMSVSKSFLTRTEGQDVAIMRAEKNLEKTLKNLGFVRRFIEDHGFTNQWFNEATEESVFTYSNGEWVFSTASGPTLGASFSNPEQA